MTIMIGPNHSDLKVVMSKPSDSGGTSINLDILDTKVQNSLIDAAPETK